MVTWILEVPPLLFSGLALRASVRTQHEMKNTAPQRLLIINVTVDYFVPPAASAAKQSGAPFPNARSVTPARLSEQFSFNEIASKAGDR